MAKLGFFMGQNKECCEDAKLEYFRKKILGHLSRLEKAEIAINKCLCQLEQMITKSGFPIGTIRDWKGKKHIKTADGWKPKYDSHTRGAKMAISAIKKRITEAKDAREMLQIVLANRDRFSDRDGHPLPFIQELSEHVDIMQTQKQAAVSKPNNKSKILTPSELKDFVDEAVRSPKPYKRVIIGKVSAEAQKRIEAKCGVKVDNINIDNNGIIHAVTQLHHNLLPEDILHAVDVINTTTEIELSDKRHLKNDVLIFKKDMDGEITFLTEVHVKNEYLVIFDAWRQKKAQSRRSSSAAQRPPATHAQNDSPHDQALSTISPESDEKSSDFEKIQSKYKSAKVIEGDEDEIHIGKDAITGKWKLAEADTPTASHDETSFHKTPGFPTNADGSTINDRDYGHDKAAQEAVSNIGADFDGRALKVDNPVVVTKDGIVISGNNRTMSSKIAARRGTDTKYIEALKKRAKKFGFTEDQISGFKNPRVIFETNQEGGYSTEQFAKFNESGKKEMGPTEKAVKVSKLIKTETVSTIAEKIGEFDTLGELYADKPAVNHIFAAFKNAGLIGENEVGKYMEEGTITEDGKTFIETALLGSVMSESNIRGFNRAGCKSIRGMLVRAITPLIENKSMTGYSINNELNAAVDIVMQVAINKDKFNNVEEFSKQQSMLEETNPIAVGLAKKMEGTQKAFAEFMQSINGSLKYAANGEADIFIGGVESRDDILNRFLSLKKAVLEVMEQIPMPELIKSLENLEG